MTQYQVQQDTKHSPARVASNQLRSFTQIVLPGESIPAAARHNEGHEFNETSPIEENSEEEYLLQNHSVSGPSARPLDWDQLALPKWQSSLSKHGSRHKKWKQVGIFWEQSDDQSKQDIHTFQGLSEDEKDDYSLTEEQLPDEWPLPMADQLPAVDSQSGVSRAVHQVFQTSSNNDFQEQLREEPKANMKPECSEKSNSECNEESSLAYEEKLLSEFKKTNEKLRLERKEKLQLDGNESSPTEYIKKSQAAQEKKSTGYNKKSLANCKKSSLSPLGYKKSHSKHRVKSQLEFKKKSPVKSKQQSLPVLGEQPLWDGDLNITNQRNALTPDAHDFVPATTYRLSEAEQFYLEREQALSRARCENDIGTVKLKIWKGLLPEDPPRRELKFPQLEPSQLTEKKLKQRAKYESYDDNLLQAAELPEDLTIVCGNHFTVLRQALYLGWGSDESQKSLEKAADLFASIRKLESRNVTYFEQNETARKFLTILDHRRKTYQKKLIEQRKMSKLEQQLAAFNHAIDMLDQADAIISANDMCLKYQFHRLTLEMKGEIAERIYEWREKRTHIYNNLKVIWNSIKENATAKLVNLTLTAMLPKKPKSTTIRKKQLTVQQYEATPAASTQLVSPQEFYLQLHKSFAQQRNMLEGEIIDRMQDVNILTHQVQDLKDIQLQEKYALLLLEAQRDLREVERLAANLEQQAREAAKKKTEDRQMGTLEQVQKVEAVGSYHMSPIPVNRYYMLM
ncbi:hypothetical protein V1508DRAFT_407396 [Lipomyces doorenjongii]|uniref:uncharacterized protein n=1 Tax=Lipomyces doorenjongii TaxID=383834 RepID=UPI0034CDDC18